MNKSFKYEYSTIEWSYDEARYARWCNGQTGFPIVDAAMRQLNNTGYMHNRCRMIVASFLAKDLLLDWRMGERYFMLHLIDGDFASNNGGWGFSASTGVDPQPCMPHPLLLSASVSRGSSREPRIKRIYADVKPQTSAFSTPSSSPSALTRTATTFAVGSPSSQRWLPTWRFTIRTDAGQGTWRRGMDIRGRSFSTQRRGSGHWKLIRLV